MSIKKRLGKLLIGNREGKTLLEKMIDAKEEHTISRAKDTLYNPLHLTIEDMVELTFEKAGTYEIFKIISYTTQIGEGSHKSVKYFLRDPAVVEDVEPLVLEVMMPERVNTPETYFLFHTVEEFGYEEAFGELLEDDFFIITEEADDEEIEKEYEKTYQATSKVKIMKEDRNIQAREIRSFNYELEDELETLYLTIEMDTDDGWITLYEGRKLLEDEFEMYQLSENES